MKNFYLFLFLAVIATSSQAQNNTFTFDNKGKTQNLTERMSFRKVNAMHMQIYREGKLDTTILMGYADKENQIKVTSQTLFNIGDMSSAIGGFIILKAITEGKMKLTDDVNSYLRSWKLQVPDNKIITIKELMMCRPNFENVNKPKGYLPTEKIPTLLQTLNGQQPCKRKAIKVLPGENPDSFDAYSALLVIQQLLEDVYQKPFAQIAEEEVLKPLKMTESSYNLILTPEQKKIAAVGYTHNGKRLKEDYRQYPEANASGLWTTPDDYAKFVWHILKAEKGEDNSLISKELGEKAIQEQDGKGRTLLFGGGSENNLYLGGASYGYRTQFQAYPKDNAMTLVFLNSFENWQFLNIDCLNAGERYLKMKK